MPWLGLKSFRESKRRLAIAFDVGTTYSGISYAILDPGRVPEIKNVTQFPAQEIIQGSSKVPTMIYYDANGSPKAMGAEALVDGVFERAEDEGWFKAEWFKLHFRSYPGSMDSPEPDEKSLPPLPPRKTPVIVLADYMAYLFQCTQTFIQEKEPSGESLWASVKDNIDFILTHPNGWEGAQQSQMRDAAVLAGLIPDTEEGYGRVTFVTEGEASLHFAIRHGFPKEELEPGEGVLILDAGGGTIDVSTYVKREEGWYDEIAAPQCHFHGSVFVTLAAQKYLKDYLADSPFLDDLDHMVKCFDKTTKQRFTSAEDMQFIKFGKVRDNDEEHGIRYGQLKLTGKEVAGFFDPAARCIIDTVMEQQRICGLPALHVVLVGGFSASNYLFNQLTKHLQPRGCQIIRPDSYVSKACSDGAISFFIDHYVQSRVSKYTYGSFANVLYREEKPEHRAREASAFVTLAGEKRLPGAFTVLIPKGAQVSEATEFRISFCRLFKDKSEFPLFTSEVWSYRGQIAEPRWRDFDSSNYVLLCTIRVDVTNILKNTKGTKQTGLEGKFYKLEYDLVLLFGLTEFKAQIAWKEKGVERRSPAQILYDRHLKRRIQEP